MCIRDRGYTIKGVQRLHKEEGMARILSSGSPVAAGKPSARPPSDAAAPRPAVQGALAAALADLETAKKRLDGLLE